MKRERAERDSKTDLASHVVHAKSIGNQILITADLPLCVFFYFQKLDNGGMCVTTVKLFNLAMR